MEIINFYKNLGETPAQALERLRDISPLYKDERLSYAGRLDPMAEGVLVVLVGDFSREDREKALNLPKTYYFEILWGLESDSFDILGIPAISSPKLFSKENTADIISKIKELKEIEYPPYSSKTVSGKPLFELAREGKINDVKIPKKEVTIFSLEKIKDFEMTKEELWHIVSSRISLVQGDFRQKEAVLAWSEVLKNFPGVSFSISSFRAEVSSGTYVRRLADILGKEMGCGALCLRIIREKVGVFTIENNFKIN